MVTLQVCSDPFSKYVLTILLYVKCLVGAHRVNQNGNIHPCEHESTLFLIHVFVPKSPIAQGYYIQPWLLYYILENGHLTNNGLKSYFSIINFSLPLDDFLPFDSKSHLGHPIPAGRKLPAHVFGKCFPLTIS